MRSRSDGRRWDWRRWYLGAGALFAAALFAAPTRALASDSGRVLQPRTPDEVRAPDGDDDDAEFQKQVKEVEKGLNELLTVDEDKKVHVKKEFAEGLPMPAPQLERMLQMSVKVGDDGKIKLRNPEQIRPFLPQIQSFLKMGGAGKLKELAKKTPEERKAEMEKMMKENGLPGVPGGGGEGRGEGRGERREGGERRGGERPTPPAPPAPPAPRAERAPSGLEDRVARLEKAIERIERLLREGGAPHRAEGQPQQGPQWHQENWGWRAEPGQGQRREGTRERAPERNQERRGGGERESRDGLEEGMRQAERAFEKARAEFEKRIRELRDRFQRGGDDEGDEGAPRGRQGGGRRHQDEQGDEDEAPRRRRGMPNDEFHRMPNDEHHKNAPRGHQKDKKDDDEGDDDDDMSLQGLGEGFRDVAAGLHKVGEVMTAEDWQMITRMLGRLAKSLEPGDLQDQGALMQKLQAAVDPQDMPRFLEIAGKVLGSPEGKAMQKRLDTALRRFEKLQGDEGFGGGKGLEKLQGLIPGARAKKSRSQDEKSRPHSQPHHLAEAPANPTRPAAARLY